MEEARLLWTAEELIRYGGEAQNKTVYILITPQKRFKIKIKYTSNILLHIT